MRKIILCLCLVLLLCSSCFARNNLILLEEGKISTYVSYSIMSIKEYNKSSNFPVYKVYLFTRATTGVGNGGAHTTMTLLFKKFSNEIETMYGVVVE